MKLMATNTEEIYVKMKIDTTAFDGSLRGMKKEMMSLRGLIGSNLVSKEDELALKARFGNIKDEMDDMRIASQNIAEEDVFGNVARFAGVASTAVAGVTAGMSMLGIESEKAGEVEKKILQFMAVGNALQALADSRRLKDLALIYGQRLKDLLIGKQILAQDVAIAGTQAAQTGGKTATAISTAANVVAPITTAVGATVGGVASVANAMTPDIAKLNQTLEVLTSNIVYEAEEIKLYEERILSAKSTLAEYQAQKLNGLDVDKEIKSVTKDISAYEGEIISLKEQQ
jgi:hypothetical protein